MSCTLLPGCLYHAGSHRNAADVGSPLQQRADANPLQMLLSHLRLTGSDLAIETPADVRDPYFMDKTRSFLAAPLTIESYAGHLSRGLENRRTGLAPLLTLAVSELEIDLTSASPEGPAIPEMDDSSMLSGISPDAKPAIMELLSAIVACRLKMNQAFAPLSQKEILFLKNYFSEMLLKDKTMLTKEGAGRSAAPQRTPLKSDQHLAKETAYALPAKMRTADLYRAVISLAGAIDRILDASGRLQRMSGTGIPAESGELKGDIIACEETPWGTIIIGGRGPSFYGAINPLLIIDLGGDDEYHNVYSSPSLSPFNASASVIIDLAGDDLYRSTKKYTQGSAAFGCSFLVDCAGDDTYLAADFSQGCGFFGVGVLDDRAGNDRYRADTMAQGAAAFGIGILSDREGNDSCHGSLYNQGSAFTGGLGLAIDWRGDDTFFSGGTYPDSREPEGAFVSFAQGCGFGDRNYASGGLGILWNGEGNDHYSGSYFAQGAGYWLGTGLLIDRAGSDIYAARRYSQGAATHRAAGALLDGSGNDVYESWGATQGCGYDRAQGLLSDGGGDDLYSATWFAQGTGGKAGTGILVDRRGDDAYRSGSFCSQGNGQYCDEEKEGSIGLALDLGGTDEYSGAGENNHRWRQGYYGGGIDASARLDPPDWRGISSPGLQPQVPEPGTPALFEHYEPLPELEIDLNYEEVRQAAVKELASRGPTILPRLLEYVRINDVQLSFTVREIIAGMGLTAAPVLREAVKEHAREPRVASFILSVLGDLKDDGSLETFLSCLQSGDGKVRTAAMRGISRLQHGLPAEILLTAAADETPAVRKFCAIALGMSREPASIKTLAALLADDHYAVRFAAFESLRDKAAEAEPCLVEIIKNPGSYPGYARELAGDLLGEIGAAGRQPAMMVIDRP